MAGRGGGGGWGVDGDGGEVGDKLSRWESQEDTGRMSEDIGLLA